MVIREGRPLWAGSRTFFQHLHDGLDGLFELRIAALPYECGIILNFDVRCNTLIFDLPRAVRRVEGEVRSCCEAAINQIVRIRVMPDESAPRSFPDQWADA